MLQSMKTIWQVSLGTVFGLSLFFTVLLIFHRPIVERYFLDITLEKIRNEQNVLLSSKVQLDSIRSTNQLFTNYDERIISMNKRFDDFYIMAGIIITLLLAINIAIYVNTDSKVDRYFKEHFEEHAKKIENIAKESERYLSQIKATAELYTKGMKKEKEEEQVSPK
jgi:hypothetical protein